MNLNWRLIRSIIYFYLAFIGFFVVSGVILYWIFSLKPLYTLIILLTVVFTLAGISTYVDCEAQRRHIAACKKKGIKPTLLLPWGPG